MLKRVVLKNPGCDFCRHYLPPFEFSGAMTNEACLKGARKIYQSFRQKNAKRRWKWVNCSYAAEKNKDRTCPDFQIQSVTARLIHHAVLMIRGAEHQHPPSFSGEIWWET